MPANREDDEFSIFRPPRTAKEQEEGRDICDF
jgi:hypothetical protein